MPCCTPCRKGKLGVRDRALLLIGFAGAFRRSELVALNWDDLEFRPEGVVVTLRHSKTDPEGQGRRVAIPHASKAYRCPIRALLAWRAACPPDLTEAGSPVFHPFAQNQCPRLARLSDKAVARVVKRLLQACGRDASEYSGHSLRAGFATAAAMGGAPERLIMNQTATAARPHYVATSAKPTYSSTTPPTTQDCRPSPAQFFAAPVSVS